MQWVDGRYLNNEQCEYTLENGSQYLAYYISRFDHPVSNHIVVLIMILDKLILPSYKLKGRYL